MTLMENMDYLHNGDDILIDQTRNFLRTTLGLYASFMPLRLHSADVKIGRAHV